MEKYLLNKYESLRDGGDWIWFEAKISTWNSTNTKILFQNPLEPVSLVSDSVVSTSTE